MDSMSPDPDSIGLPISPESGLIGNHMGLGMGGAVRGQADVVGLAMHSDFPQVSRSPRGAGALGRGNAVLGGAQREQITRGGVHEGRKTPVRPPVLSAEQMSHMALGLGSSGSPTDRSTTPGGSGVGFAAGAATSGALRTAAGSIVNLAALASAGLRRVGSSSSVGVEAAETNRNRSSGSESDSSSSRSGAADADVFGASSDEEDVSANDADDAAVPPLLTSSELGTEAVHRAGGDVRFDDMNDGDAASRSGQPGKRRGKSESTTHPSRPRHHHRRHPMRRSRSAHRHADPTSVPTQFEPGSGPACLFYIHGGGFIGSSFANDAAFLARWARKLGPQGFILFPHYSLSPEARCVLSYHTPPSPRHHSSYPSVRQPALMILYHVFGGLGWA